MRDWERIGDDAPLIRSSIIGIVRRNYEGEPRAFLELLRLSVFVDMQQSHNNAGHSTPEMPVPGHRGLRRHDARQ